MKHLIPALAGAMLLLSFHVQDQKAQLIEQFARLQGDWDGFLEYTDFSDDRTKYSLPAKCSGRFENNKWIYEVFYDEGDGNVAEGGGECTISDDGTTIDYNGIRWTVTEIVQNGDTALISMSTRGKDNRKKADLRQKINITSGTFTITEEVKYDGTAEYFVRNRHLFRKKKG